MLLIRSSSGFYKQVNLHFEVQVYIHTSACAKCLLSSQRVTLFLKETPRIPISTKALPQRC